MNTALQIFIYIDVFLVGIFASYAVHHAYSHFYPVKKASEKDRLEPLSPMPAALRKQLIEEAQNRFETAIGRSAKITQQDLLATEERLTKQLDKLGHEVVNQDLTRLRQEFEKLRAHSLTVAKEGEDNLGEHQKELEAQLDEAMTAEKQHLTQQIDNKLADAVASFLMEAMQHDVDLGSQESYIMSMLEEHKDDFKKEVEE